MKSLAVQLALGSALAAFLSAPVNANPGGDAMPMKTKVQRFCHTAEVKPESIAQYKELAAKPPQEAVKAMTAAHLGNCTLSFKKIEVPADSSGNKKPDHLAVFNYQEYSGSDYKEDMAILAANAAYAEWDKACEACLVPVPGSPGQTWTQLETLFFTDGASDVVPTPEKFARTCMITGLKPEKEMEYRLLHANIWPAVNQSIKDGNVRDFSIYLAEIGGNLYLFGYLEYVGKDGDADDAKAHTMFVNQRWWKLTDACQQPLPDAAVQKKIWIGADVVFHLD